MVSASANACLLLLSLTAGGSMLVWWAREFHRRNEQLWMVPLGLIMMGTPVLVWFVVFASDACQKLELLLPENHDDATRPIEPPPPPPPPPQDHLEN